MSGLSTSKTQNLSNTSDLILWKLPHEAAKASEGKEDEISKTFPNESNRTSWLDAYQYILHGAQTSENSTLKKVDTAVDAFRQQVLGLEHADKMLSLSSFGADRQLDQQLAGMYQTLFKSLNIKPSDVVPQKMLEFCAQRSFADMTELAPSAQLRLSIITGKAALAKLYEFPPAQWKFGKGIDLLFQEVSKHKVVVFCGTFTEKAYTAAPHVALTVDKQEIYGWKPSERNPKYTTGKNIGVVGVRKETDKDKIAEGKVGHVIYVNSLYNKDPEQQKFYISTLQVFMGPSRR